MASLGISADITAYLASRGHGMLGVNLFTDDEPADPDNVTVINRTGAGPPPLFLRDSHNPVIEYPRIQVVIRGTSYADVLSRAEAVNAELLGIVDTEIKGIRYSHIWPQNSDWIPFRDDRNRHVWRRNYQPVRDAVTQSV